MKLKRFLVRVYWLLSIQFGIDLRKTFRAVGGLPRYINDLLRFHAVYTGRIELQPCLHDWYAEGGTTKSEYFWQDLLVARMIYLARPARHIDIGSRVDGFVAHVASFREIEIFDIRPITTQIPGVIFRQCDLMKHAEGLINYCDSLSCLHTLEHFGLGRYGDPIDPMGFEIGFKNMTYLLKNSGIFYLSVPIGIDRVEFNANRVFDPHTIVDLAKQHSLKLATLTIVQSGGKVETFALDEIPMTDLAKQQYSLGIFTFVKCAK